MKSMTGFAKTQFEIENKTYSIEIKTLNSKQLDIITKLPFLFHEKETEIRSTLSSLLRGKVEFSIIEDSDKSNNVSSINFDIARTHYDDILKLKEMMNSDSNADLLSLVLAQSDVWEYADVKELTDTVWQQLQMKIKDAIVVLDKFRLQEGEILKKDFIYRIDLIESKLEKIPPYEDERIATVKERMRKYLLDLDITVDENRFEQEIIYYLEKFQVIIIFFAGICSLQIWWKLALNR